MKVSRRCVHKIDANGLRWDGIRAGYEGGVRF